MLNRIIWGIVVLFFIFIRCGGDQIFNPPLYHGEKIKNRAPETKFDNGFVSLYQAEVHGLSLKPGATQIKAHWLQGNYTFLLFFIRDEHNMFEVEVEVEARLGTSIIEGLIPYTVYYVFTTTLLNNTYSEKVRVDTVRTKPARGEYRSGKWRE